MKGYNVSNGYMGWVGTKYMLFENEGAYIDYVKGETDG